MAAGLSRWPRSVSVFIVAFGTLAAGGCGSGGGATRPTPSPSPSATVTVTETPSVTPTHFPTATSSSTPSSTPTPTTSPTPTHTATFVSFDTRPDRPEITSPIPEGVEDIAAADVHMECTSFHDADGDGPRSSHWEIWDVATDSAVWRGIGQGLELSHVHLTNGTFEGVLRGERLLEFDHAYRLRVRYRDDGGDPATEWSDWSDWRHFRTAAFGVPELVTADVLDVAWVDETGQPMDAAGTVVELWQVPADAEGRWMLIHAFDATIDPPAVFDLPARPTTGALQLRIRNEGSAELSVEPSQLLITIEDPISGEIVTATAYLPTIDLVADAQRAFWLGGNGATFDANSTDSQPTFTRPVRETETAWVVPPGFVVEEAQSGLEFPTQIVFNPAAAVDTADPLYFVMELKGRIWAVGGDGERWLYADNLIDFSAPAPSGNAGQVGLGGMAYEPESGDMFVTRTYRAPAPPIAWSIANEPAGLEVFLPSTASWSSGSRETKVVRYLDLPTDGTPWSFSARIRYPVIGGRERWIAGMAFGIVAYSDVDNALFANFQSNRHRLESLVDNEVSLDAEVTVPGGAAGWLRMGFDGAALRVDYRRREEDAWQTFYTGPLPFTPTRVGINARNFFNLVGEASFTDIRFNDVPVDPVDLLDDTTPLDNTWLHNQVIRLRSQDGGHSAAKVDVVLDMPNDISHESHQIQDIEIDLDGRLLVSVGDGFNAFNALDMNTFLGKLLRLEQDGSAPADNPFFDPNIPIAPRSYIRNPGLRNTYGMALRRSDGRLFCSENGPSRDRIYTPDIGVSMGYDGTDSSMRTNALFTWLPSIAPVGIDVMQTGAFPVVYDDWIFVGSAGQDFVTGSSRGGKRIHMLQVDADGRLADGPEEFLRYEGSAKATVIGLAFGPDGLYFTTLYNTDPTGSAFTDARVMRVRWVGGL